MFSIYAEKRSYRDTYYVADLHDIKQNMLLLNMLCDREYNIKNQREADLNGWIRTARLYNSLSCPTGFVLEYVWFNHGGKSTYDVLLDIKRNLNSILAELKNRRGKMAASIKENMNAIMLCIDSALEISLELAA